jgi:hypothetical protein
VNDLGRDEVLAALLRLALSSALGVALPGCGCGIFARAYGPSTNTAIALLDPALDVHAGADGMFDAATCTSVCPHRGEKGVASSCSPTTFAVDRTEGRVVVCGYDVEDEKRAVRIASAEVTEVEEKNPYMAGPVCDRLCRSTPTSVASHNCVLLPPPPVVPADRRFVVCRYVNSAGCRSDMPAGRAHEGLVPPPPPRDGSLGEHFATMAYLEAASVSAFRILAAELFAHGAPAPLVRRARRSARDEARHAASASVLARRFGAPVTWPQKSRERSRSLREIAIENASAGCVGETLGAALAMHQAHTAMDLEVRRAMEIVGNDEARHASLAWAVHAWCCERLDARERAEVEDALDAAARDVVARPPVFSEVVTREAGLPGLAQTTALVAQLDRLLWRRLG